MPIEEQMEQVDLPSTLHLQWSGSESPITPEIPQL